MSDGCGYGGPYSTDMIFATKDLAIDKMQSLPDCLTAVEGLHPLTGVESDRPECNGYRAKEEELSPSSLFRSFTHFKSITDSIQTIIQLNGSKIWV